MKVYVAVPRVYDWEGGQTYLERFEITRIPNFPDALNSKHRNWSLGETLCCDVEVALDMWLRQNNCG